MSCKESLPSVLTCFVDKLNKLPFSFYCVQNMSTDPLECLDYALLLLINSQILAET